MLCHALPLSGEIQAYEATLGEVKWAAERDAHQQVQSFESQLDAMRSEWHKRWTEREAELIDDVKKRCEQEFGERTQGMVREKESLVGQLSLVESKHRAEKEQAAAEAQEHLEKVGGWVCVWGGGGSAF